MKIQGLILLILCVLWLDRTCSFALDDVAQNIHKLLSTKSCIGCNLVGADLLRAKLKGASLRHSKLDGARLCLSVLTNADFEGASLRNVEFCGADISGANFVDADLTNTSFDGVYARGVVYERKENSISKETSDNFDENYQKGDGNVSTIQPITSIKAPKKKIINKIDPIKTGQ